MSERDVDTGRFTDSEAYDEHESTPHPGPDEDGGGRRRLGPGPLR